MQHQKCEEKKVLCHDGVCLMRGVRSNDMCSLGVSLEIAIIDIEARDRFSLLQVSEAS